MGDVCMMMRCDEWMLESLLVEENVWVSCQCLCLGNWVDNLVLRGVPTTPFSHPYLHIGVLEVSHIIVAAGIFNLGGDDGVENVSKEVKGSGVCGHGLDPVLGALLDDLIA